MKEQSFIPLSIPLLKGNEKAYVEDCIATGWISSVGSYVGRFETEFAQYVGADHAVAVVNGTSALHLALLAAGVEPGAEVICPTLTFIAPVNAVAYCGALPVFADCDATTLSLSPDSVRTFIEENCEPCDLGLVNRTTGRRVSALVAVHIMGHAAKMDELVELSESYNLPLIEDCAEAVGVQVDGQHVGLSGVAGCFSFNGNKMLTTGGGGMLVSHDESLAAKARHLSTQAKADELTYQHDMVGYNYRMNNIQAALGVAQLEYVDESIARKREIHGIYQEAFSDLGNVELFCEQPWCRSNYWLALLLVPEDRKMALINYLRSVKIEARPLWELNHRQPMFVSNPKVDTSVAERLHSCSVNIPCHQGMTDDEIQRVIAAVSSSNW